MGRFESIGSIQPFLKLKEGIWADVYKAYDTRTDRTVLLKMLKPAFGRDPEVAERFAAEARLMERIEHPSVVTIFETGTTENTAYFVAEFIEGASLDVVLKHGDLPPLLATYVAFVISSGLAAAHEQHIFHRDIKPSNVLIGSNGAVKLSDFGMASVIDSEAQDEIRGTLAYLAPEFIFDKTPAPQSDLFSLGATLFEMLAGRPAFHGTSTTEVFDQLLHVDPLPFLEANPRIPPTVIDLCRMLLEKNPANRPISAAKVQETLHKLLKKTPEFEGRHALASYMSAPDSYVEPEATALAAKSLDESAENRNPASNRKHWAIALAVLLLTVLGFGIAAFMRQKAPDDALLTSSESAEAATLPVQTLPPIDTAQAVSSLQPETPPPTPELPRAAILSDSVEHDLRTPLLSDEIDSTRNTSTESAPQTGELLVLCTPFCEIEIDGTVKGEAPPLLPLRLSPGTHTLTLTNPQFPPYDRQIDIVAGQRDSIRVPLRNFVGTVELNVVPWADVYVDSVHYGKIPPIQTLILRPGSHTLTLKNPDLGEFTTTLIVGAGEQQSRSFNLRTELQQN